MKGRSISESFILATELVQCCYKRKIPTLVIKLDFVKAYDSVNWQSLMVIIWSVEDSQKNGVCGSGRFSGRPCQQY
jgi:hypothetical protein